jgi:hypothetical protein
LAQKGASFSPQSKHASQKSSGLANHVSTLAQCGALFDLLSRISEFRIAWNRRMLQFPQRGQHQGQDKEQRLRQAITQDGMMSILIFRIVLFHGGPTGKDKHQ